jgi:hypothetical protein
VHCGPGQELGAWTTLAGQGAGLDEFVQRGTRSGAIGGKISPIQIPAMLYFAAPLWLS